MKEVFLSSLEFAPVTTLICSTVVTVALIWCFTKIMVGDE